MGSHRVGHDWATSLSFFLSNIEDMGSTLGQGTKTSSLVDCGMYTSQPENSRTTTRKTHTLPLPRPRATTTELEHSNYWTRTPQLEKPLHSTTRKSLCTAMQTQWAKTKSETNKQKNPQKTKQVVMAQYIRYNSTYWKFSSELNKVTCFSETSTVKRKRQ